MEKIFPTLRLRQIMDGQRQENIFPPGKIVQQLEILKQISDLSPPVLCQSSPFQILHPDPLHPDIASVRACHCCNAV